MALFPIIEDSGLYWGNRPQMLFLPDKPLLRGFP
jgi:hypothetical protein